MKNRGFEIISLKQFKKDFKEKNTEYVDLKVPTRATKSSAGYDFYAPYEFNVMPGEIIKIATGIKAYMNNDEFLALVDKSSSGFKYNIRLCNQIGIIDSDYYNNVNNEGHIYFAIQNEGEKEWVIKKGESFAQGIFMKYLLADNIEDNLKVRQGGLGSTKGGRENE